MTWSITRTNSKFPKGDDVLAFKVSRPTCIAPGSGLLYVPVCTHSGRVLSAHQLRGIARVAQSAAAISLADRHLEPICRSARFPQSKGPEVLTGPARPGDSQSWGAGGDNIRNVTGTPDSGDRSRRNSSTRCPCAGRCSHYILNHREMYGLPHKFQHCLRRRQRHQRLEDSNDIGFTAVTRRGRSKTVPAGVYFRLQLGGISGHQGTSREHWRAAQARGLRRRGGRRGPRLHRAGRPHRPQEGPPEVRSRSLGAR